MIQHVLSLKDMKPSIKKHFRQLEILLQISQIILQGIARQKLKEMQVVLTLCEVS